MRESEYHSHVTNTLKDSFFKAFCFTSIKVQEVIPTAWLGVARFTFESNQKYTVCEAVQSNILRKRGMLQAKKPSGHPCLCGKHTSRIAMANNHAWINIKILWFREDRAGYCVGEKHTKYTKRCTKVNTKNIFEGRWIRDLRWGILTLHSALGLYMWCRDT